MRIAILFLAFTAIFSFQTTSAQNNEPRRDRTANNNSFRSLFTLANVEFTDEQASKVKLLREEFVPLLTELVQKRNSVLSREARRAMQEALTAARKEGKSTKEARDAAYKAAGVTQQQRDELAQLQQQQAETVSKVQVRIRGLLTEQQMAVVQRGRNRNPPRGDQARAGARRVITPSHADVSYGPFRRNVMDVWLADSDKPAPVLVSIHGGGFRGGNKSVDQGLLRECLEAKISVVAITYRLSDEAIAPAQFLDSARAVQFIRHNAKQWNLDPKRIAATGGSAGAGISLWLGFHDDLADVDNKDPVLRESTRLNCMAVYNGQTSYDPRFIRTLFAGTNTYRHPALSQLFDIEFGKLDQLGSDKYDLFREVSALPHASQDDVPTLLIYASNMDTKINSQGVGIHHPRFGQELKEKMDQLGIECTVETGVRRGNDAYVQLVSNFIKRHLDVPPGE